MYQAQQQPFEWEALLHPQQADAVLDLLPFQAKQQKVAAWWQQGTEVAAVALSSQAGAAGAVPAPFA